MNPHGACEHMPHRMIDGLFGIGLALAVLMVFLILAAQYESWSLPFSVLLGTPFAVFGAYFGLWAARQFSESYVNNVFAQIALIMLIGLAAKNAILIVEFAVLKNHEGLSPSAAAIWSAVWVAVSLIFCAGVYFWLSPEKGMQFLAGYLLEKSLSVDNMFVFILVIVEGAGS